jgi:hypothetical protein
MKTYNNINVINENIITMLSNFIIEGRMKLETLNPEHFN